MNFIKRALLSTKAKKGRSFLLLGVFSAILVFILAGLTIQSASIKATEDTKKSMGATVTLGTNKESRFQAKEGEAIDPGSFSVTPVLLADVFNIAELENVASYNLNVTTSAGAESFEPVSSTEETTSTETVEENMPRGGIEKEGFGPGNAQGDLSISGTLETELLTEFSDKTATIIEGSGLGKEDVDTHNVVIETSLAKANEIKVGDTIVVSNPTDDTVTYEAVVKGIYETEATVDSRGMNFNFLNPSNTVYASYTFVNMLKGEEYKDSVDTASYNLEDPEAMDAFVEAAEKSGLDMTAYSLQTNDLLYQQMIEPLDNVASFAEKIVILVTVAGIIILSLIVMMMIRERKYEIGVLLSLGEKRTKVISQFFVEMCLIMLVSLCIAGASGTFVGNIVGEQLLSQQTVETSQQVATSNKEEMRPDGGVGGGNMISNFGRTNNTAEQIEALDIILSLKEIIQLGGIGLAICFLSIICSSIGIMRLQPKKILTT